MPPTIAIVGSVDPTREAELELVDVDDAPKACEELGAELATQGCHLIVFHSDAMFVEGAIVRGYVASGTAEAKSVQVRYPEDDRAAGTFPEMSSHRACFDVRPSGENWEVAFYRSMNDADGVLLVGGGRSTLIAGLIAVSFGKPLAAISAFGGKAREVRRELERAKNDATDAHLRQMAAPWGEESAGALVRSLLEQRARHEDARAQATGAARKEGRRKRLSATIATIATLLAVVAVVVVMGTDPGSTAGLVALLAVPVLMGVSGAIVRDVRDGGKDWWTAGCLGLIAGLVASGLFVATQLITSPDALKTDGVGALAWIMLGVGFVAGLTTDRVFRKLSEQDVTDVSPIEKP